MVMASYTGSGPYCYSHSLYMILYAYGYDSKTLPSSGFIECLTTMPFGKHFIPLDSGPLSFFNNPHTNPDDGLDIAIKTVGWECTTHRGGDATSALSTLREALIHGPVLAGPLNMEHLTYNPNHEVLKGADHFVVVLGVDNANSPGMILLHDPAGFPAVVLPIEDFVRAWRAEGVEYVNEPFIFRSRFRKVADVSRAEMIARTLHVLRRQIEDGGMYPTSVGGSESLRLTIQAVKDRVPSVNDDLAAFTLPLASRRYFDARDFLAEAGLVEGAGIMEAQAMLAGRAQYPAVREDWGAVVDVLEAMVALEDEMIDLIKAI
ncbi:NlpC/p60-like transpeptidase [Aspergillus karnatakaensis]|uniref:NlpC/p60-like transpeptidase n=1 Tax=Aspergillus karnatakaensis TaxID=1810916 RepID=UPI003CCE1AEC